ATRNQRRDWQQGLWHRQRLRALRFASAANLLANIPQTLRLPATGRPKSGRAPVGQTRVAEWCSYPFAIANSQRDRHESHLSLSRHRRGMRWADRATLSNLAAAN